MDNSKFNSTTQIWEYNLYDMNFDSGCFEVINQFYNEDGLEIIDIKITDTKIYFITNDPVMLQNL